MPSVFAENGIDLSVLQDPTDQDLREVDVLLGDRREILCAICDLRTSAAATASTTPGNRTNSARPRPRSAANGQFCDLVGSMALSARLNAELRSMIRADHQCVAETVARIDGVTKYMGDGVPTYFGYPQAHEDAERAVRTGLAPVEASASRASSRRSRCASPPRRAWSVISSAAGRPRNAGSWGETPNLTARPQGIAALNPVVIAEGTRRLFWRQVCPT
jgi:class 3 adenylate cyclase